MRSQRRAGNGSGTLFTKYQNAYLPEVQFAFNQPREGPLGPRQGGAHQVGRRWHRTRVVTNTKA